MYNTNIICYVYFKFTFIYLFILQFRNSATCYGIPLSEISCHSSQVNYQLSYYHQFSGTVTELKLNTNYKYFWVCMCVFALWVYFHRHPSFWYMRTCAPWPAPSVNGPNLTWLCSLISNLSLICPSLAQAKIITAHSQPFIISPLSFQGSW